MCIRDSNKNGNQGNQSKNNGSRNNRNNGGKGNNKQPSKSRKRKNRKKPKLDPLKYWGDPGSLPTRNDYALESPDSTAVIRSLGKAPIPGKNSAPELYFEVLYTRAAGLAQALAFAGGLNQDADTADTDAGADTISSDDADQP